jgi:hypothetical protein
MILYYFYSKKILSIVNLFDEFVNGNIKTNQKEHQ